MKHWTQWYIEAGSTTRKPQRLEGYYITSAIDWGVVWHKYHHFRRCVKAQSFERSILVSFLPHRHASLRAERSQYDRRAAPSCMSGSKGPGFRVVAPCFWWHGKSYTFFIRRGCNGVRWHQLLVFHRRYTKSSLIIVLNPRHLCCRGFMASEAAWKLCSWVPLKSSRLISFSLCPYFLVYFQAQ